MNQSQLDITEKVLIKLVQFRVRRVIFHIRRGKENKYPRCCVLHFVLDNAWHSSSCAMRRGIINRTIVEEDVYVPCLFHKKRHPLWEPWD